LKQTIAIAPTMIKKSAEAERAAIRGTQFGLYEGILYEV